MPIICKTNKGELVKCIEVDKSAMMLLQIKYDRILCENIGGHVKLYDKSELEDHSFAGNDEVAEWIMEGGDGRYVD